MSTENDTLMDKEISDLYQSTKNDGPSTDLDAAILAQAGNAVAPKRKRPAWIAPVGLAATLFLGINLAVNLKDYSSAPEIYTEVNQSSSEIAAKPEDRFNDELSSTVTDNGPDELELDRRVDIPQASSDAAEEDRLDPARKKVFAQIQEPAIQPTPSPVQPIAVPEPERAVIANFDSAFAKQPETPAGSQAPSQARVTNDAGMTAQPVTSPSAAEISAETEVAELISAPDDKPGIKMGNTAPRTVVSATPQIQWQDKTDAEAAPAPMELDITQSLNSVASETAQRPVSADLPTAEDSGLQEVVVTGSRINRSEPHSREPLTAKAQAKRNERERGLRRYDDASPDATPATAVLTHYVCDLEALGIDNDKIETTKIDARNEEPPLNALTWPGYIRDLAENKRYIAACSHLAAYQRLYPDVVMIEPLPLSIPESK